MQNARLGITIELHSKVGSSRSLVRAAYRPIAGKQAARISEYMRGHSSIAFFRLLVTSLTVVSVLGALLLFCWTLLLWSRWHPDLPWRDVFVILDDLQAIGSATDSWRDWLFLFEAHYAAHRIAIPRALVLLDTTVFSGKGHLLYASAWAALLVVFGLYARLSKDYFRGAPVAWMFCCGIVGMLLFAPAHLWNLVNAINSSWHISFALAALALYVLQKNSSTPSVRDWVLAYALAGLVAFTTFTGVILWLLLPVVALGGSRRVLLVTVACSLAFTLLYLNGIASDADIAAAWDGGDPVVAAKIQEAGRAAIADNSLGRILSKTSRVLCWPMSEDRPALAGVFFAISLLVLGAGWLHYLKSLGTARRPHPWLQLCLFLATLALGVALAIQLGRMIEQPNYAHGPSYERYNTIVAVYWLGVLGLIASLLARLDGVGQATTMSVVVVTVLLLLDVNGQYLQQEISSTETAARLYAGGETPAIRGKLDRKLLRFKPEYVYNFDPFFTAGELAYRRPVRLPSAAVEFSSCSRGTITVLASSSEKQGFKKLEAKMRGLDALLARDIILSRGGSLLARMYATHDGDYSPLQLIEPSLNRWIGYIDDSAVLDGNVLVTINKLMGYSAHCAFPDDGQEIVYGPGNSVVAVRHDV